MLPVRLTLRNFLPYRVPDPVVLEGLHLAVLSGPNGAGKSALLDAITWALWGRARAKSDQDLIALGADNMRVELDFEQEGTLYRVTRQRERKRRVGTLSLFIWDEDVTGGFNEISASTMRETQVRINALLRLDYETFVHSAFLQQGKADAFTTKTPAQRKQILADILGLDAWGQYEEKARRQLRDIDTALSNIEGRLQQIEEELAREDALKHDLASAEESFAEAEAALQEADAYYDAIKDAPAQHRAAMDRLVDLERRLRNYVSDTQAAEIELTRQAERIAGYEAIIAQKDVIEDGFATLEESRVADQSLSDKLMSLQEAEKRRHDLEQQIAAGKAALQAEARDHQGAIDELARLTDDSGALTAALDTVLADIQALEDKEAERETCRTTIAALDSESASLRTANDALLEEMNTIKGRMDALTNTAPSSAICPTCQQPLAPKQRAKLLEEYQQDGTSRGNTYRDNQNRLTTIKDEMLAHEAQVAQLGKAIAGLNALRQKAGELQAKQAAARDADTRLAEAQAALASVQGALEAENYAGEPRAQLAALQDEIATLGYDKSAHTEARENLSAYRTYETRHHELGLAMQALPDAQEARTAAENRLQRLRRAHSDDEQAYTDMAGEVERLKALVVEANQRFDEAQQKRTTYQMVGEKRARAQQALHALDVARQRQADLLTRRDTFLAQQGIYEQLRDAFGKNGIPAMIIEASIPELEDDANDLLTRMTGGAMQLSLNTQREKVSGGIAETLDIIISDAAGTRDYALYSGGEAFRINFALRIALSKLLARRAGAHLQTLFIDEGFGTQDAMGRERLVEAINAIADDFELILIITHIDDLRDAFPARLEVEKSPSGSRVRIG